MEYNSFHFIGIGGIGMSGIAQILLQQGYSVTGSDVSKSAQVARLEGLGAKISMGHSSQNIAGSDVVIVSSAISINNPEVKTAIRRGIPILHRSEMLALLMKKFRGIGVSGTHGKTTATSMISLLLERADMDPTIIIGGILDQINSNAKLGKGEFLVAEADESDGSLVRLSPEIAVVTNIEADHMDYYTDLGQIKKTFENYLSKLPENGLAILCTDDHNVKDLSKHFDGKKLTYGLTNGAMLKAIKVEFSGIGSSFTVIKRGLEVGLFRLNVPGVHNVYNALAAIGLGIELGIDIETIRDSILEFNGAKRRFQILANHGGTVVVDDYAHHPTEIMATLSAARKIHGRGRIISVFQPHRFSRTQYFFDLYGKSFFNSDNVIVTDIYSAGEEPIPNISGELIAKTLKSYGHQNVMYIPKITEVTDYLAQYANKDDFVITLGAGDVWKVAHSLSDRLKKLSA
ncbi:MAG TPA: UDP-N-acetylmuramate--L-alanine ligase [bacterium]|nr:UDP-N-acetylmuramate--L-alanine ligase [bacterium]